MSMELHDLGITLERLVSRLNADLLDGGFNHADFYDYGKNIVLGIRQCLVRMRENIHKIDFRTDINGSPRARFGVGLDRAIDVLTTMHNNPEYDPEKRIAELKAIMGMLGTLEASYQHLLGNDQP